MCGIAGLIGESSQPKISYQLMSKLLNLLERRGEDATGLWGTQRGELNGKKTPSIIYHKEPVKSSDFVRHSNVWKRVRKFNPNLLLLHARSATPGVGQPSFNKNNHPFVSRDMSLSIVHNGKVPEYNSLRDKFKTFSNCDSEILLRIILSEENPIDGFEQIDDHKKMRLSGIKKIWSLADAAHMAVAVGEFFPDGTRHLWLWRNVHRPLWLADMRDTLGQVFFFSEPTIWYDAIKDSTEIKNVLSKKQRLIEIPTEQVWHFEIDPNRPIVAGGQYWKFNIKSGGLKTYSTSDLKGISNEDRKIKPVASVICNLDDEDEPLEKVPQTKVTVRGKGTTSLNTTYNNHYSQQSVLRHHHGFGFGSAWAAGLSKPRQTDGYGPAVAGAPKKSNISTATTTADRKKNSNLEGEIEKACANIASEVTEIKNKVSNKTSSSLKEFIKVCDDLEREANSFKTSVSNAFKEGSVDGDLLTDIYHAIYSIHLEIQGTGHLVDNVDSTDDIINSLSSSLMEIHSTARLLAKN